MGAERRELEVDPTSAGVRLDLLVARGFPDLSRSYIQKLVKAGHVRVDGDLVRASASVTPGQRIVVDIPPTASVGLVPQPLPLSILYEDGDVLVVDKPAGLVVHPGPGHPTDTLVNAVLARYPGLTIGGELRPGIVHRLDKDTSGLLVVARSDRAMASLTEQMRRRAVRKEYLALVVGGIRPDEGVIDAPLGRHPVDRKRMAVVPDGREARTHFRVLERLGRYTLLEVRLETGRTHQIRVHFASLGHPLVGDAVYGASLGSLPLGRQFLHAHRLGFVLPSTGQTALFESPLPSDLAGVLDRLRGERSTG